MADDGFALSAPKTRDISPLLSIRPGLGKVQSGVASAARFWHGPRAFSSWVDLE
jgi:hypothetical protein